MKSKSFYLSGGNYTVSWTATDRSGAYSVGCYHGGTLEAVDKSQFFFEMIGNDMVDAGSSSSGSTELYGVRPGSYYLDMSSGCDWVVTITPHD
jgi:hypothetical protein